MADLRRVRAIVKRQLFVQKRAPHRWFDMVVWPIVDTVLWGSIGLFVDQQGGATQSGTPFMLSGILLMHVVYQANISMATGFMDETWSRNIMNVMVSPIREIEYALALAWVSLIRLTIGLSSVAVAAAGLYAFNVTSAGLGLVPVIAILMLTGWCVAMIVIGLVLRYGDGAEILAWGILFIVIALSGAFYPPEALPGVLRPISYLLPSTHAFDAARDLLSGQPVPWGRLGLSAAGLLAVIPLCVAYALRMLKVFRLRGYVTRYS